MGLVQALKRQSGAKDVVVNFKNGTAAADWKKGAQLDFAAIKKAVDKSAELTFRSVELVAEGEITRHDGHPALRVTGSGQVFLLASDPEAKDKVAASRISSPPGARVVVRGKITDPGKKPPPLTLTVSSVEGGDQ